MAKITSNQQSTKNSKCIINEKEAIMANNDIITNEVITEELNTAPASIVDIAIWYQDNYCVGAPTINGVLRKDLAVGGVNEADVREGIKVELEAIRRSNGDVCRGMNTLMNAMQIALDGIIPGEQIEIKDIQLMIDYNAMAIYTVYGREKVADLEDMSEETRAILPREVVKALLVERATNAIPDCPTSQPLTEPSAENYYEEDEEYYQE